MMVATKKLPRKSLTVPVRTIRCAVYTRKSTDENLESDFNSLDAQREAAEAYIASQKAEGWVALETRYDDPAYSAATTDRPALQRLLVDIEAGEVDAVVVYKIDRLSRSLRDFGKLMEIFEQNAVAFVSVTQRFDTSSSVGKLTLNILMSFAEFERGITRERILDKIASAKKRGRHCGGVAILGFDTDRIMKRLVVNEDEAKLVKHIFTRFIETRSTMQLADELNRDGYKTKAYPTVTGKTIGGKPWTKAHLYALINNPKYIGKVEHKGTTYNGEHQALIDSSLWDAAHKLLNENCAGRASTRNAATPALLKGIIKCATCRCSMGITYTRRKGRTYRFYLCSQAAKKGYGKCPLRSVSAGTIESATIGQVRIALRAPELIARVCREARLREAEEVDRLRSEGNDVDARALETHALVENDVIDALKQFDRVWDSLFPSEQHRIVQLLIESISVAPDGIELRLRADGLKSLLAELTAKNAEAPACP
jgi:site-specific DNA recombinase